MEISRDKCTFFLIAASFLVLAVGYELVSFSDMKLSFGSFSLSGIESKSDLLYPVTALSVILALLICHLKYVWIDVAEKFHEGYRESPDFVELIRRNMAKEVKSDRYRACNGGLRPSFRIKKFDLGKFTTDDGKLTKSVIVEPDITIHVKGCIKGIFRAFSSKLWLSVYAPSILGIWALCRIAV